MLYQKLNDLFGILFVFYTDRLYRCDIFQFFVLISLEPLVFVLLAKTSKAALLDDRTLLFFLFFFTFFLRRYFLTTFSLHWLLGWSRSQCLICIFCWFLFDWLNSQTFDFAYFYRYFRVGKAANTIFCVLAHQQQFMVANREKVLLGILWQIADVKHACHLFRRWKRFRVHYKLIHLEKWAAVVMITFQRRLLTASCTWMNTCLEWSLYLEISMQNKPVKGHFLDWTQLLEWLWIQRR